MYKAEFDWKSSGYLTKRVIVCDEGRRGSGKNNGIPNIPSMLRLSLTAYIRISASNHLFCIYEVQKRFFDKRGTYEINVGKLKTIVHMIKGHILKAITSKKKDN